MRKLTLITLIIMLNSQAWAAATPQASRYDARIQQVIYNPQNVTVV
ncbi:P-type conjugative transfer protein VirB9, partial [Escherichia coli]